MNIKNNRLMYGLVAVLLLLVAAAVYKARMQPKGTAVEFGKVERRTIDETVSASGKVFPETEVKISSDVSGEIVELFVKEGDTVKIGQILAKIRPDEYQSAVEQGQAALQTAEAQKSVSSSGSVGSQAQVRQLEAERDRANAQLTGVRASHQRNEKMHNEGIVSSADYDASFANLKNAEAALNSAEAAIASAKANYQSSQGNVQAATSGISSARARLKELKTSLDKTTIRAPMNGVVSKLNVEKGERVVGTLQMAGTELMRVADMSRMEVQVEVSENDILKVSRNDTANVEIDAYLGRIFKGKVTEISSSANNISGNTGGVVTLNTDQVTNFIVKILLDPDSYASLMEAGKRHPFRPGMSAAVDIFTNSSKDALTVPIIAVTTREEGKDKKDDAEKKGDNKEEDGLKAPETARKLGAASIRELVFLIEGDSVVERTVRTGIQDNDFIEIIEGLTGNETVVVGPYSAIARDLNQGEKIHEKEDTEEEKK